MAKQNQIMVDLESFGQIPTSAIASIGAVVFNTEDGIVDRFYVNVDPRSTKALGFYFCPETMAWWRERPIDVQRALLENPSSIQDAMAAFCYFVKRNNCKISWAWGSSFDHSIIAYTCHVLQIPEPWKYYEQRCARTIGKLFDIEPSRDNSHHNALADAEAQANLILEFYRSLDGNE